MILWPRLARNCSARRSWRVPFSVRCFATAQQPENTAPSILFFGSDTFSLASLNKLYAAHKNNPDLYESLQIVTRKPAPQGRGLKETPTVVEKWAKDYNMPYTSIVKGQWDPLQPFLRQSNLIVAVSFGLFIPAPVLRRVSTVNVHPSILPQYRGPCPIHHALINNDHHTGVTLQTLSPRGFDKGIIFKQSPLIAIEDTDRIPDLWTRLADTGAEMLLDCIQARTYLHPTPIPSETQPSYAGFIPTGIDWESTSPRTAISKSRVFDLETGAILLNTGKRTPIHIRGLSHRQQGPGSKIPGDFFVAREPVSGEKKMVVVCLGGTVFVEEVKVSGRPWINGVQFVGTAEGRFWGGRFVPKRTEFEGLDQSQLGYE